MSKKSVPIVLQRAMEVKNHLTDSIDLSYSRKNGYVMMLDVLGFREFVSKRRDIDFFDIWKSIKSSINKKRDEIQARFANQVTVDFLCLSDTLIVCISLTDTPEIKGVDDRVLITILPELINSFFQEQMQFNSVFFRGAISYGQYSFSSEQNIIMGPALDEASEWYEAVDWIGIILSPSAEYAVEMFVNNNNTLDEHKIIVNTTFHKYPRIPFKTGIPNICHYAFCWIDPTRDAQVRKDNWILILGLFSQLKHSIAYAAKYSNALDFIKYILFDEHESKSDELVVIPD